MARARNIKPGFFQNDLLGALEPLARLLFIGLWTIADFNGCLEFRPKRIKALLLPYDECDPEKLAINLERSGFIRSYSVQGQRYLKIVNFLRHQNPHKNEREAGTLCPDESEKDCENSVLQETPDLSRQTLEQDGTAPASSLIPLPSSLIPCPPKKSTRSALSSAVAAVDFRQVLADRGIPEQLAADWLTLRKGLKAAVTETVLQGIEREAAKARLTLAEALAMCCERSWRGFKADWVVNGNGSRKMSTMEVNASCMATIRNFGKEPQRENDTIDITPATPRALGR
jgi:hypothetical protein